MLTVCIWCGSVIEAPPNYDDLQHKVVCSQGCRDAETLFCMMFSDEEINRRNHYIELTQGEGNAPEETQKH